MHEPFPEPQRRTTGRAEGDAGASSRRETKTKPSAVALSRFMCWNPEASFTLGPNFLQVETELDFGHNLGSKPGSSTTYSRRISAAALSVPQFPRLIYGEVVRT